MTNEQREFHKRMNAEIEGALGNIMHEFDITRRDLDAVDKGEVDVIRSNIKALMLKAYARNHSWIND